MLTMIFLGLVPLIVFAILDSFSSLKISIIGTLLAGFIEVFLSLYFTGSLDEITFLIFVLLIFSCLVSLRMKSNLYIKLQPALVSLILSLTCLISYLIKHPLFVEIFKKYKDPIMSSLTLETFAQLGEEGISQLLTSLTLQASLIFFLHSLWVAWSAIRMSKWSWLLIKAFGIYILAILLSLGLFLFKILDYFF